MLKRIFDISLSFVAALLTLPIFVGIAVLIRVSSPGPVLYRGLRAGRYGRPFRILKFRTMVLDADRIGGPSTSADDPRVTRVGAFLRRFKLDELPQIFNVLAGQMSIVGPRPEVMSEVENYTEEEKQLLTVRPGITDWASIRFRNEAEILRGATNPHEVYLQKIRPEKVRLGLQYVRNHDLLVDLRIILQTCRALLS